MGLGWEATWRGVNSIKTSKFCVGAFGAENKGGRNRALYGTRPCVRSYRNLSVGNRYSYLKYLLVFCWRLEAGGGGALCCVWLWSSDHGAARQQRPHWSPWGGGGKRRVQGVGGRSQALALAPCGSRGAPGQKCPLTLGLVHLLDCARGWGVRGGRIARGGVLCEGGARGWAKAPVPCCGSARRERAKK